MCFVIMGGMQWSEFNIVTEQAPKGIISFEFARDMNTARAIIASWREAHVMGYAGFNVGLDFLFLLIYPVVIGLVIVLISSGFPKGNIFRGTGFFISWLVILAALLDAVENVSLINLLTDSMNSNWVVTAYYCSISKFILIGLGITFIVVGGIAHGILRALKGE